MNRQQRRDSQYKRHQQRDRNSSAQPGAAVAPLIWSQKYTAEDAARLVIDVRMAWQRLTHGEGSMQDYDTLGQAINILCAAADYMDAAAQAVVEQATEAMHTMKDRHQRLGCFGADAQALACIPGAIDGYEALVSEATPRQVLNAARAARITVLQQIAA